MTGGGGDSSNVFSFRLYDRIREKERESEKGRVNCIPLKRGKCLSALVFIKLNLTTKWLSRFCKNVHGFTIYTNVLFTLDTFLVIE